MNDRYLYRAKQKNWREIPKDKWWVEGYYAYFKQNDNHCIYYETDGFTLVCDIDISTLCACTGLKDKNGKLIWENDIVRYCDCTVENYVIAWEPDKVCFEYQQYGCSIMNFDELSGIEVEVIGNIFDNPELLELHIEN